MLSFASSVKFYDLFMFVFVLMIIDVISYKYIMEFKWHNYMNAQKQNKYFEQYFRRNSVQIFCIYGVLDEDVIYIICRFVRKIKYQN